jgi:large subunit ribosomal protein L9
MKVILTQPVTKLGKPGDVVNVADGYGRNFLLPRQMAILADKGSLKQAERLAAAHEQQEARLRTDAQSLAARLGEAPVTIEARVGHETTKLYGSVTSADIAEAVQKQLGVEVDRRRIELEEPIRNTGDYTVPVRVHADVTAQVQVKVVPLEA